MGRCPSLRDRAGCPASWGSYQHVPRTRGSTPRPCAPGARCRLKNYKYKPAGYTILDVIHTPMWEAITNRLPLWLAPNLITLTGLLGVILAYLFSAAYSLDFTGGDPGDGWPGLGLLQPMGVRAWCQPAGGVVLPARVSPAT